MFACYSYVNVTWKFNGGPILPNVKTSRVPLLASHKLEIKNISMGNTGKYTCYGSDRNNLKFQSAGIVTVEGERSLQYVDFIHCFMTFSIFVA